MTDKFPDKNEFKGLVNMVIKVRSRVSVILPNCLGLKSAVYYGKEYIPVNVKDQKIIGHKFGWLSIARRPN
jgi:small subunit ribosomal protein S19